MRLAEITEGQRFDSALAAAEGWRLDARLYRGQRRKWRLDRAHRMEQIAERIAEAA